MRSQASLASARKRAAKPRGTLARLALLAQIGSLRNDDGDGYENVTEKVNLRCFKLYRAYSIPFNVSNVGKFDWS